MRSQEESLDALPGGAQKRSQRSCGATLAGPLLENKARARAAAGGHTCVIVRRRRCPAGAAGTDACGPGRVRPSPPAGSTRALGAGPRVSLHSMCDIASP